MTSELPPSEPTLSIDSARQIDRLCDAFEKTWIAESRPIIEDYLLGTSDELRHELLRELIHIDLFYRRRIGDNPAPRDYHGRFAEIDTGWLEALIAAAGRSRRGGEQSLGAADGLSRELTNPLAADGRIGTIRYFGDYELLEEIARGGMGVVFKARQVTLNRIVAVKMILSGQLASPADVERFHAEAEAAANLDHPGIVPIFEVGEHEGQHYFSMGFVDGRSLSARVSDGPLPGREAAQLVRTVCDAVQYAHEHQVIHRDLKPANILLDRDGRPRVTDFGLAKRVQDESGLTATGQVLGTPSFMPPEQAAGKLDLVGPAADVYSLGAILYTLLTGRPPFQSASSVDTLRQVLEREPLAPRDLTADVPRDLETIVLKCLEKSIPKRYASARELADELQRFLDGRPILARPVSRRERAWRWCRRNPVVASLVAAVATSLVVGTAVSLYFAVESNREAEANLTLAKTESAARAYAVSQRTQAENNARTARHRLYLANMKLAQSASEDHHVYALLSLLKQTTPQAGEEDLRGFEWHYWNRICHPDVTTFTGHTGPVRGVAFNPNGTLLASAGFDSAVKLWDLASGKEAATLPGHRGLVICVAFSPDGSLLASAGEDATIRLWDVATRKETKILRGHSLSIQSVAFSHDGKWLVSGSYDQTLKLWDVRAGKEIGTLEARQDEGVGPPWWVMTVAISPDDTLIASGNGEGNVRLWDADKRTEKSRLMGHSQRVLCVAFSSDGQRLASASDDHTIKIWDVATGKETTTLRGHVDGVWSVGFSPDGRQLFSASHDATIKLWDLAGGKEATTFKGHTNSVETAALSRDGKLLASGSFDRTIQIRDIAADSTATHLKGVETFAFRRDGRCLAAARGAATITLLDVATGSETAMFDALYPAQITFSPDGDLLAAICDGHSIKLWDVDKAKELTVLKRKARGRFGEDDIDKICFSRDGRHVVGATRSGTISLWTLPAAEEVFTSPSDEPNPLKFGFSPDSKYFAVNFNTNELSCWNVATGRKVISLKAGGDPWINIFAFSPNGKTLAAALVLQRVQGLEVRQWDLATGTELPTLKKASGLTFDLDGQLVETPSNTTLTLQPSPIWHQASGMYFNIDEEADKSIRIRDPASGNIVTLTGHGDSVLDLAFSLDGRRVATASGDETVKVWDLAMGQETLTLKGHKSAVIKVNFSRDGRQLASLGQDGTVMLWDASPLSDSPATAKQSNGAIRSSRQPSSRVATIPSLQFDAWSYPADENGIPGYFKMLNSGWVEAKNNQVHATFKELRRTAAYVELHDEERGLSVRLTPTKAFWLRDQNKHWAALFDGAPTDSAKLPPIAKQAER